MSQKYLKDDLNPFLTKFQNTIFLNQDDKCFCHINSINPVETRAKSSARIKRPFNSWIHYVMYVHILLLYGLLFSVYNELKQTKDTLFEYQMNMINISMRGLEIEKNCLSEISNFRKTLKFNDGIRFKRNTQYSSETEDGFDSESVIYGTSEEDIPHIRNIRKAPNSRRGKAHRGKKNSRRRKRFGFPRATHLIGGLPEPIIRDGGWLAPWIVDKEAIKDFSLNVKLPDRGREAVEIIDSGLYFIYSQVYYMSPNDSIKAHSSFYIMVRRGATNSSSVSDTLLAQCATIGDSKVGGEASCFTGTAQFLLKGDIVYIKQRERDRHIVMRKGQTFFGLVLLQKRMNEKSAQNIGGLVTKKPI